MAHQCCISNQGKIGKYKYDLVAPLRCATSSTETSACCTRRIKYTPSPQDETSVSSSCLEDVKCKSTCSLQEEECHHYGPHLFKFWCFSSCIIYMLLFEKIQTFLIFCGWIWKSRINHKEFWLITKEGLWSH
jgi:hypothetical protein